MESNSLKTYPEKYNTEIGKSMMGKYMHIPHIWKRDRHLNIPQITFLGAARTVTGSKYLIEYKNKKILVDCGLFQGIKDDRLKNRKELPVSPKKIDAIILTHAHLDHSGYIPLMVKEGFKVIFMPQKQPLNYVK